MKSIDGQSLKSTPAEEPPSRTDTENMSKRPLPVIKKTEKIPILVQPPKKATEP
jgi:hypothetical protein